jgi:hypothetical protein
LHIHKRRSGLMMQNNRMYSVCTLTEIHRPFLFFFSEYKHHALLCMFHLSYGYMIKI